jgi:hypothetical protein
MVVHLISDRKVFVLLCYVVNKPQRHAKKDHFFTFLGAMKNLDSSATFAKAKIKGRGLVVRALLSKGPKVSQT